MNEFTEADVYQEIGEDGIARMVAAFYRQIPHDDLLGPMYPPQELGAAERRLKEFLVFRLGGPQRYLAERGHPRLRLRHAPFAIDRQARDRWIHLMSAALDECRFPEPVNGVLRRFFDQTATFLINRAEAG